LAALGVLAVLLLGGAGLLVGRAALLTAPEPAPPGRDDKQAAVDRYGDPLPPGAVVRLGTVRYRHATLGLTFLADGKTLVAAQPAADATPFWVPRPGKLVPQTDLGELPPRESAAPGDPKTRAFTGYTSNKTKPGAENLIGALKTAAVKELRTFERDRRDS